MGHPQRHKCPGCGYEGFMQKAAPFENSKYQAHVRKRIINLRAIRKEYGLSQQYLADIAGLHRNTVARIERGEGRANRLTQVRLMQAVRTLRKRN